MLRPSKLHASAADGDKSTNNVLLKPSSFGAAFLGQSSENAALKNPFLAINTSIDEESQPAAAAESAVTKTDENQDPLSQLTRTNSSLPKSNLFAAKSSISEASGFVFGQNIGERVTGTTAAAADGADTTANNQDSNLLFSSRLASAEGGMEKKEVDGQSLLEATRKYEEKCKVTKRKYEEVETKTGEEDERNVAELNCKVFAFVAKNYEERGRGTLRLNDSKANPNESRVVFRTSGNFRVLINTKVWPGMAVELASAKSLRMTVIDSEGQIKVFLIMARPDDVSQLHKMLTERVNRAREFGLDDDCPIPPVEVRIEDTELSKDAETGEPQPKKAITESTKTQD